MMLKRIVSVLLILLLLTGCGVNLPSTTGAEKPAPSAEGTLEVHFIDVGQADAALLVQGDDAMLIDGGNVADSSLLVSYLLDQGIEELDCVVATHPHEDHVGGLSGVLAVFPVETVYVTTTTYASKCYDDFMYYVDQQEITPQIPSPGDTYALGECEITFLGPVKSYADTNDTSLVCRADYGDTSFLFTGDMERQAEDDLVESGAELKADVLKVGHHGSSTSTGDAFLSLCDPEWAVISCGTGNSYGHPHEEVLSRLRDAEVTVYRTDLLGTLIAQSDGKEIVFHADGDSPVQEDQTETAQEMYIGNVNSRKFHLPTCSSLPEEKNRIYFSSYDEAVAQGYSPCGNCLG